MKRNTISKRNQLQILDNVMKGDYPTCTKKCLEYNVSCPEENSDCRMWMDYEDDLNCTHAAVVRNGRIYRRNSAKTVRKRSENGPKPSQNRLKPSETV